MWNWIKGLFGVKEALTLAMKHADALADEELALSTFNYVVEKFNAAAEVLREVANEAEAIAKEHAERAETAIQQAVKNEERAAKVSEFFLS